uniref:Uncharacterized protein n=1 Tax=Brassica oleracea var. oleracea TaxID=109376 RepID=A0A0D3CU86_BRAOL
MMIEGNGQHIMLRFQTSSQMLDDLAENQRTVDLLSMSAVICKHIWSPTAKMFFSMREKRFEYRYATEDELGELKQREFSGWMLTYVSAGMTRGETFDDWIHEMVCYIKYPRVRNRDDPWVTVTSLNPRGRVQGSSELEDPLQPSTSGNLSAAEDLAAIGLVVDLTDFGEEASFT